MSIVLGIETAIGEGSVAVVNETAVFSKQVRVSRAETLVSGIENVLANAGFELTDVDTIALSRGPGSFTGIRIGIATALGLQRATGAGCIGVSLFDAVANSSSEGRVTVAISLGRQQYGLQEFGDLHSISVPLSGPVSLPEAKLLNCLERAGSQTILFCGDSPERSFLSHLSNVHFVDEPLAVLVARLALDSNAGNTLEPIYLGK